VLRDLRFDKICANQLNFLQYFINLPFVFSAESPTDSILNGVATAFILEIEDLVKVSKGYVIKGRKVKDMGWDWNNDLIEGYLIRIIKGFINIDSRMLSRDNVKVERTPPVGDSDSYRESDTCYFFLENVSETETFLVKVLRCRSGADNDMSTITFVYTISGEHAQIFFESLKAFECIQSESFNKFATTFL
jgi:hypothetical protein